MFVALSGWTGDGWNDAVEHVGDIPLLVGEANGPEMGEMSFWWFLGRLVQRRFVTLGPEAFWDSKRDFAGNGKLGHWRASGLVAEQGSAQARCGFLPIIESLELLVDVYGTNWGLTARMSDILFPNITAKPNKASIDNVGAGWWPAEVSATYLRVCFNRV
ncbi:hypothetical protein BD779DRAFT_1475364 [Infundibulicybe gibba]|nr:hypothetical protein BD779DRAFT_1475364 [Infundibulicybe gibba]